MHKPNERELLNICHGNLMENQVWLRYTIIQLSVLSIRYHLIYLFFSPNKSKNKGGNTPPSFYDNYTMLCEDDNKRFLSWKESWRQYILNKLVCYGFGTRNTTLNLIPRGWFMSLNTSIRCYFKCLSVCNVGATHNLDS